MACLDVGGEVGEVEDLGDSGAGDAGGAGDLGLVFELAGGEQVVQANGEGHQLGDVWHLRWCGLSAGAFRCDALSTCGAMVKSNCVFDVAHELILSWLSVGVE